MNTGVLLMLLAVNPPSVSPSLSLPGMDYVAPADTSPVTPQAIPGPGVAPPTSTVPGQAAYPSPGALGAVDGVAAVARPGGGCCGGSAPASYGAGSLVGMDGAYGWFDNGMSLNDCCGYGGLGHRRCHHCDPATHIRCRAAWNLSPGDMYPWTPYFPVSHGTYYFRPYYFTDVWKHQQIAARWGANPMSPYTSGDLFQNLYVEMGLPGIEYYEEVKTPPKTKVRPSDHFRPAKQF